MALPLPLRNRLAELILDSLHDPEARSVLQALVRFCAEPEHAAPPELAAGFPAALGGEHRRFRDALCERGRRAWEVVGRRPPGSLEPELPEALGQAADLFGAGLFFEVHELLEPYWVRADGLAREALQGLIQIAVGFQHLANGNLEGAAMLLAEGSTRVDGKTLAGLTLSGFAQSVRTARDAALALGQEAPRRFDWSCVPRFPRGA